MHWHMFVRFGVVLAMATVVGQGAAAHAQTSGAMNAEQVALLEQLDAETSARVLAAAQQVAPWQQTIAQLEAQWQAAQAGAPDLEQLALEHQEELKQLYQAASDAAAQLQGVADLVESVGAISEHVRQVQAQIQAAAGPFTAATHPDLTAAQLTAANAAHTQAQAAAQLLAHLKAAVAELQSLRDPAQYADSFLRGKFQQWLGEALAAEGEAGDFKFKIIPPAAGTSVFSKDANLGVEIEYMPGDLTVLATGLYFEYRPGGVPRPVLENLRVDPSQNLQGMVLDNVKQLGNELLAGLDMPIRVEITGLPDFSAGGPQRGGLQFKVAMKLFDAQGGDKVELQASDLTLYPGNRVEWGDAELAVEYPANPPIPIPGTPLAFWTFNGAMAPKTGKITAGTKISSVATPATVVALHVELSTAPPIERIELTKGDLLVAGVSLGSVTGHLDFGVGELRGQFTAGNASIPGLQFGNGTLELRSERLALNTSLDLFGVPLHAAETVLHFDDGSATLTSKSGLQLFGADFSDTLTAQIDPGFSRFEAEAVHSIAVPGLQPYGTIDVSVTVRIRSDASNPVEVEVNSFLPGGDFTIGLPNLNECTLDNLRKWIQDKGVDSYHQFLQNLANTEKEGRKWAAKLDEKTRRYVSDRLGGPWSTGNEQLDQFGGQLSEEFKNVVGGAVGGVQQAGGVLADISHNAQDEIGNAGTTAWETVTGIFP